MYPVSQEFLDKIKADRRQVFARVEIDYTDPFMDQSIDIEASEQANVSYPQQTADSVQEATHKWASLDGSWVLDGTFALAPPPEKLAQHQFGWWGLQLAGAGGVFLSPYPTLTVTHLPRPVHTLRVVGDTARVEYPVDFEIKLYGPDDTLLKTETVTGNTQVNWSKTLAVPVLDVAKQVLTITRWSHEGRQAKIIEFFTSIREVYETGDLVSIRLLEEREASQGSLPVGNISSNEITLALNNEDKKFDVDNEQSPLKNLLKPNRRIQVWLGSEVQIPEEIEEDFSGGTHHQTATDGDDLILAQHEVPTTEPTSLEHDEDLSQGELDGVVAGEAGLGLENDPYLYFNGTSAQVKIDYHADLQVTNNFKFRFKVKINDINQTDKYLISKANQPAIIFGYVSKTIEFYAEFYTGTNPRSGSGIVINDTGWHEVIYEYDGINWAGYLDGNEIFKVERTFSLGTNTGNLYFGSSPSANFLDGYLDDIEIWKNGVLQGHWKFDEGSGTMAYDSSGGGHHGEIINAEWVQNHTPSGSRTSPPLDLSSIGTVKTSEISWQATEPEGTGITIETAFSTDGGQTWGAWQTATNGQAIPGILPDMDLSNTRLKTRATLETTDTDITPTLEGLNINLTGEKTIMMTVYFEDGCAVSDPIPLSSISRVRAGSMAWQATLPEGTTAAVETALSLDGGQTYSPWQEVQPGQPIPGIEKGQDLANAYLKIRANLTTKDVKVTPILHPITIYLYSLDNPTVIEEYIPLGTFWSLDWDSPDDTLEATVTARDRMELLRKSTFQTSQVLQNKSLYELAEIVLQDAGLMPDEYIIDPALHNIVVPYSWFNPVSHREALRRIAEAGLAAAFQNRDGKIQIESFLITGDEPVLEITEDDYFPPLRAPSRQDQVANEIIVDTQPLRPATTPEEVYRSNEPITIPASTTKTITAFYNKSPVIEATASLDNPPAGVSITEAIYYGWGASIKIQNTNATDKQVTLAINGKPLTVQGKERAIARDEASITDLGVLSFEVSANPLIQTLSQAQAIADALLASMKDPRRDIEVEWRGNPALELGDRVTVKNQDYHVIRQEIDWAGALSARLTGRKVGS